jgi:hypothetical protein
MSLVKMGDWKKVDEYYLQNGEWTICKISSVKNPYELWRGKERIGMFKTANEAKQFQSSGWPRSSSHPANKGEKK